MMESSRGKFRESIPVIFLCLPALAYYQILIHQTSTIYWNDAHIRWALRDQLFLGEWLPGVQIFVFLISKITSNLDFLQSLLSLLAIGSLICAYIFARHLFSPVTGSIAFLFLAFNSMFAAFAIVPYSEMVFVGFVFLIFIFLDEPVFSRRFYLGIFFLSLASLTSYRGWFLAVFFIVDVALRSFCVSKWQAALWQTLKMAIWCSLAPILWLMFGADGLGERLNSIFQFVIAPSTPLLTDHILARFNINYIFDFSSQFFDLLRKQIHMEFVILAVLGILFAILNDSYRSTHWRILLFLILDFSLLAFFQPWKFGSLRQPFFVQVFLVLYASYGLVSVVLWVFQRLGSLINNANIINWVKYSTLVAAIILTAGIIPSTFNFIVNTSREADFLVPFKISTWLEPRLSNKDAILVIDDTDYYPYALASYFEYPLGDILDDRLDSSLIQERLENSEKVYIIELYKSQAGLSAAETRLLEDLTTGKISAERFVINGANVWYASSDEVFYSP